MKRAWVLGVVIVILTGSPALPQKTSSASGLTAGLTGEYFNGPNFERKVLTRTDPQVAFDWNWQMPGPGVQREYFSVRWTGKLFVPTSGSYRFSATVDDGVRVWVNGKKVIDEWRKQDDIQFVGEITLTGNRFYDLRIEYYNDWKGSNITVLWQPPTDRRLFSFAAPSSELIPTKYLFSRPARPAPALPVVAGRAPTTGRTPVGLLTTRRPISKLTVAKLTAPKPVAAPAKRTPASGVVAASKPASTSSPARSVATTNAPKFTPTPPTADPFATLKIGEAVVLRHVVFAQSAYTLLPEAYAELDKLVRVLQTNPALRVEIGGHTDDVGDKRLNQSLSEYRAKMVVDYLTRQGVAATRLTATGYGGSRPLAGNDTEARRAQNRRVEFTVQ